MGWDSIFIPEGMTKTRAELTQEEDDQISPRMKALDELAVFFKSSHTGAA
jgi:inosine/xanthosine triphosphate pyrophosphatase family protein